MSAPRLVLTTDVQVLVGDRVLVGGAPGRFVRLHDAAPVCSTGCRTLGEHALARRLLDAGTGHAVPRPREAEVTVVVPVRDRTVTFTARLGGLRDDPSIVHAEGKFLP